MNRQYCHKTTKQMRMKKIFALGLSLLLFAMAQSWASAKAALVDDDVNICYVINADQIQVNYIAVNNSPMYLYDYTVLVFPDVGSYLSMYIPKTNREILWQRSETLYNKRINATGNQIMKEGLLRLDIGEGRQAQAMSIKI